MNIFVGAKIYKLTILDITKDSNSRSYCWCKCECGNLRLIEFGTIKRDQQKSCGCYRNKLRGAFVRQAIKLNEQYIEKDTRA